MHFGRSIEESTVRNFINHTGLAIATTSTSRDGYLDPGSRTMGAEDQHTKLSYALLFFLFFISTFIPLLASTSEETRSYCFDGSMKTAALCESAQEKSGFTLSPRSSSTHLQFWICERGQSFLINGTENSFSMNSKVRRIFKRNDKTIIIRNN